MDVIKNIFVVSHGFGPTVPPTDGFRRINAESYLEEVTDVCENVTKSKPKTAWSVDVPVWLRTRLFRKQI